MASSLCSCMSPVLVVLLLCLFLSLHNHLAAAAAADTLLPGQSITGNQTLVAKGGTFELGFFSPGNSRNWFLGIWFGKIPQRTVVWVANREAPLDSSGASELKISGHSGGLILLDRHKTAVWSSPSSSFGPKAPTSTLAVLLDTGNFVFKDGGGDGVLWQSFDHPADTILPGQKYGYNKTEGRQWSFTSWRNSEDPAPGGFSSGLDPSGRPQIIMVWNKTRVYWSSGFWDGGIFASVPEMMALREYSINYFSSENANYFTYSDSEVGGLSSMWMDVSGQWKWQKWSESTQCWLVFSNLPRDPCDVYLGCGLFSVCSRESSPSCNCPPGFRPRFSLEWGLGDHAGGCVRETPLDCGGMKDEFQPLPDVRPLPTGSAPLTAWSTEECELACLKDCQCTAYSYGYGCLVWRGEILNMKQASDAGDGRQSGTIYLRLAAASLSSPRGNKNMKIVIVLCVVVSFLALALSICAVLWKCRVRQLSRRTLAAKDILISFRYKEIKRMTRNFCEMLGEGGCGSVYRGILPDSSAVAVKKLKNLRHGEKQFRMEVSAMGAVHHINILRLQGFCCEGTKRLLVYDYMAGGSLDSYLSSKDSVHLDWDKRYHIALGVARGLAYLHEKCRERIIHCDIKPENILLDETLCPKVADFGMAKLIGRHVSRVITTTRGTIGYLAPEWISGVDVTLKVDVYSFGMMLFEIISGSRNGVKFEFPLWATRNINQHEIFNYIDGLYGDIIIPEQFIRACKVASWCIQDSENDRPSMGQVIQVLEGALDIEVPPVPRLFQLLGAHGDVLNLGTDDSSYSQILSANPAIQSLNHGEGSS